VTRPSVVVHGHFYQPPREDPRTDRVPLEASAAPYHDWNERILAECYRPVTEARLLDAEGRIRDVLNTLEWMSWDAGPTLLRWLAREAPATYAAFLEADRRSLQRTGFGNALAAPYHHVILPLASRREKVTEVRWGMADFRSRFGRDPDGMWLPETAVDTETLEVLAQEGIAFTVLAPGQVERVPRHGMPGRVALPGGRSIAVFVYDGGLSHGVAFGSLLGDADAWIRGVIHRAEEPGARLVSLATDGETFGHHHRWADMALASTLAGLETGGRVRLEGYAAFLSRNEPAEGVTLVEPSSWSCSHGVDRWRAECGCKMAPHEDTQQAWRPVLRDALDELASELHALYQSEASRFFDDPWQLRDAYGSVLDAGEPARRELVGRHARETLSDEEAARALTLLEIERDALRMFTSCGWFFDDLAGLEPLQVLRYAAHALDGVRLLDEPSARAAERWEERLRSRLSEARSNDPDAGDGRRLWDERVRGGRATGAPGAEGVGPATGDGEPAEGGLRGAVVRDAPLLTAVRRFLRAPGPAAALEISRLAGEAGAIDARARSAAQSLLARALPRSGADATPAAREVVRALGFGDHFFDPRSLGGRGPVGFVFGLHLHQPVGNFDEVFRSHTDDVYLPFLRRMADHELLPLTLHVSGPLLQWLEHEGHELLDVMGELAASGSLEVLLSGLYEPVLPALSRRERVEQIGWMRDWVERRLGVEATGLWLTERVWEPDLVVDLADAGIRHAFVDDRHFLVAGHEPHTLHQPHRTESGGRTMTLLPIDERLRYLVPFKPVSELERYLRGLRAEGRALAILADDGEKFGGWPGTAEWVWQSGWIDDFVRTMGHLVEEGVVELLGAADAVEAVPAAGPSYLPSASYSEMEGWSLPPASAVALESVLDTLGRTGAAHVASRFVRGGHWRNFMSIYAESGRMHRKAALLADLCAERDAAPEARHALGRARCNDAYWHGVFGGLYLRHLREAVWANLAEAEGLLRAGEPLSLELLRGPAGDELWIHSGAFSAAIDLERGGAVTELVDFAARRNLADVLTRRWESYHRAEGAHVGGGESHDAGSAPAGAGDGMPSIHALEERLGFEELPPYDPEDRALTVERVLHGGLSADAYARADYEPIRSWSGERPEVAVREGDGRSSVGLAFDGPGGLVKEVSFEEDGTLEITYRWNSADFPPDAWFAPELSLSRDVDLVLDPAPADVRRYEIRTMSKSEQGPESSVQGVSLTPLWPASLGRARLRIEPDRIG
jgi:alpha-amylase/alpha-mannosidase (GH57 family)